MSDFEKAVVLLLAAQCELLHDITLHLRAAKPAGSHNHHPDFIGANLATNLFSFAPSVAEFLKGAK